MEDREKAAWSLFAVAVVVAALAIHHASKKPAVVEKRVEVPREIVREVPREIIKTVVQEVPRDVIRTVEVPKEVIRTVEVPQTLTPRAHYFAALKGASLPKNVRDALHGIERINVVCSLDDELLKSNAATIKTKLELRLRGHGITVADDPLLPTLYIRLTAVHVKAVDLFAFSTSADLEILGMHPTPTGVSLVSATVWQKGGINTTGVTQVKATVEEMVGTMGDYFANDWLAANPKR